MKALTPGHKYELANFEESEPQVLQFIEKGKRKDMPEYSSELNTTGKDPEEFITYNNGTTNEEVLAVLIDRMKHLNGLFPCRENSIVITKLEESLMWLEKRTADRVKRGVEGKPKA